MINRVQAQMNRNCLNAAEQLRCENEDKNVTEEGTIHVIYLTWLTVITAGLTFLLCAQNWDPPSNQRLMSTLALLILTLDPIKGSDMWCENKTAEPEQLSQHNQLVKNTAKHRERMKTLQVRKRCRNTANITENIFKLKAVTAPAVARASLQTGR